jgi:glucokinase
MKEEVSGSLQNLPLVMGVDLGGTQIRLAVLQGAKLLSRVCLLTGEDTSPSRIIPRIYFALQQALDEADMELDQIAGIGIGVAGPLDSRTGVVFAAPNLPGWDHVPLHDIFKEQYSVPVFVENDANVAALGEYMFGAGYGCKDMVYLTISTGIGGGVITNGQIMGGTSGTAGELGHMTINLHGERCNCGNIGCLESTASGTAIARRANEAIARGAHFPSLTSSELKPNATSLDRSTWHPARCGTTNEPKRQCCIDAKAVAQAAEAGVPVACTIIRDAAEGLGVGLVNIIHIFNPEMIILGGSVTQMGPLLIEPALGIVQERAMKAPCKAVRIVQAQLGANAGLVGAGALIYYNIGTNRLLQGPIHTSTPLGAR